MTRQAWIPVVLIYALASGQQAERQPSYEPFPLRCLNFDQEAASIEVLAIVRAETHHDESRPSFQELFGVKQDDRQSWITVERAKVLTGIGIGAGSEVDLVATQAPPMPPRAGSYILHRRRPSFTAGKTYLIFGLHATGGRLPLPIELWGPESLTEGSSVGAASPNEVSLMTAFRTDVATLPVAASPKDRLIKALIEALPATSSDWDFDRLIDLLVQSRRQPPPESEAATYFEKLRGIADTTSSQHVRFYARALLAKWHAPGARARFIASLLDVVDDASFIVSFNALPFGVTTFMRIPDPEYPVHFDQARANYLAATARNEELRHFLFGECAQPRTREEWTRFVKNLDTEPRDFVDRTMLKEFALWSDQVKDKSPIIKLLPGKVAAECINHDELVAYWKSMYP